MALQNDNTILNKGDLKAYHQKILPFLGGNIATTITNGNIYSQEERVVGIWVDGRPLYQKTYILNLSRSYSANTTYNEVFDSDTNKAAVKVWGTYEDNDGRINIIESFYNWNNAANNYVPYLSWCYNYVTVGSYIGHQIMYKGGTAPYTCKQMVITMQYWKKTDTADTAAITPGVFDINRPDLWPVNKEIFFGNGLYGYRASGNFAAGGDQSVPIISENISPYNYGGWIDELKGNSTPATKRRRAITTTMDSTGVIISCVSIHSNLSSGINSNFVVHLGPDNSFDTTCKYDLWVTYTK